MNTRNPVVKGGMFGSSKPQPLSKETKELMKVMMEESKLTNFQRRKLNESVNDNKSFPITLPPTSTIKAKHVVQAVAPKSQTMRGKKLVAIRTKEAIQESGAYDRDKFKPKPTKSLEKEKDRLSNIMAFGEEVEPPNKVDVLQKYQKKLEEKPQVDRFDEILEEIEERKSFLRLMESSGQHQYRALISTQISQLIREMEIIDAKRNLQLAEKLQKQN